MESVLVDQDSRVEGAERLKSLLGDLLGDPWVKALMVLVQINPVKVIQRIKAVRTCTGLDLLQAKQVVMSLYGERNEDGTTNHARDVLACGSLYWDESRGEASDQFQVRPVSPPSSWEAGRIHSLEGEVSSLKAQLYDARQRLDEESREVEFQRKMAVSWEEALDKARVEHMNEVEKLRVENERLRRDLGLIRQIVKSR